MGTVYKAMDLSLNRYLALKILRSKLAGNPIFVENFISEAQAAAAINHPNVAQVYSFGEHAGQCYLAMELLERGSLDDRMARIGKISEKDLLEIALQVSQGLRAAHQRGLLHRDIKPGNILFNDEGVPKLVDFGLARPPVSETETDQISSEPIWGTPYYIAPEKLMGQREDERSDIYSLGASFFHALAGRPPFDARTADEVVTKHATTPAYSLKTFVPTIHPFTAHVIGRMLAKNPAERYANCNELLADLQAAEERYKLEETQRTVVTATGERIPMTTMIATGAAVIACLALLVFLWINHVRLFDMGTPAANVSPLSHTGTNKTPAQTEAPVIVFNKVDFSTDEPWVKTWEAGTLQLAQGHYQDALFSYDNAIRALPSTQPAQKRWYQFYEAITLFAWDRPSEARQLLTERARIAGAPTSIPSEIELTNFVDVLINVVLDQIPVGDLEKAAPRLPGWANGLATLTMGFKKMEQADFKQAAAAFRRYEEMKPDNKNSWAFNLQTLAPKLQRECQQADQTLADISNYERDGQLRDGLRRAREEAQKTTYVVVKAELEKRIRRMKVALEQQQQHEQEAQSKAAEEENKRAEEARRQEAFQQQDLAKLHGVFNAFMPGYDFKGALAKADEITKIMRTAGGRDAAVRAAVPIKLLADFKAQLGKDFTRRGYDRGDLQTRANAPLSGTLKRATETQLMFTTPYGDLVTDWRDMSPATLVKLADYYTAAFSTSETAADQAHRYLLMAVFSKQYDLEKQAQACAARAVQLNPALQPQVDSLLPKPAPSVTAPAP